MIIDHILDRRDGDTYNPKQLYDDCMDYGEIGHGIASAMDSGTESDVKIELIKYVLLNSYYHEICKYILEVDWL